MFYISALTGELIPFDPQITSRSDLTVAPVKSVAAVGISAVSPTPASTATESSVASSVVEAVEDGAVFDGHVIPTTQDLTGGVNSLNIARAGVAMAYRAVEAELTTSRPMPRPGEKVTSVAEMSEIGNPPEEARDRVNPITPRKTRSRIALEERRKVTCAADIMSSPVFTLREDEPLKKAEQVFREKRFRHIPIVSAEQKVVGCLSDRDMLRFALEKTPNDIPIKQIMVTNILTARPEAEIRAIAEVMITHRVGCLPIVNDSSALVGLLTRSDILRAIVNHAPIELWT